MARLRFSRSTCQISGAYVPVAEMQLHDDDWVYFSHHVLLHTEPRVGLESMRMQGGWNRIMAGMPLIMMRAQGPGFVAFSADHPGEILAIPLEPNQGVDVVEHQFLLRVVAFAVVTGGARLDDLAPGRDVDLHQRRV